MGRYTGKRCRLLSMFGLTTTYFVVELVVGHLTNSMALIADSFHMLSDIAALIIAFVSVKMAPKSWDKNTYGWARAEVLGALVNAVFLVALCFSITMESLKRFYEPEDIHDPKLILTVGALGLVVNLLGLCLFHEHGGHGHSHGGGHSHDRGTHSHISALATREGEGEKNDNGNLTSVTVQSGKEHGHQHGHSHKHGEADTGGNLNMRGVFLHVMADALGSVIVIISAVIMWQAPEWPYTVYVDPALSLFMVMLMMWSVWPLLIESALILLQTVPTHIDIEKLKRKLLENIDGILAVHEFHIWQLAGDRIIASAHIRCLNLSEYMKIAENVKEFFHNEGIHSTTIQPEFVEVNGQGKKGYGFHGFGGGPLNEDDCVLGCPKAPEMEAPSCQKAKCCVPTKDEKNGAGILGMNRGSSKSSQNTPTNSRKRPSSFVINAQDVEGENGEGVQISPSARHYDFSTSTPAAGILATYKDNHESGKVAKSKSYQRSPKMSNVVSPRRQSTNGFESVSPIKAQARLKSKERLNFSPSNFGSPATVTTQVCTIDDLGQSGASSILEPKAAVDLSDLSSFGDDGGNGAFADELGFTPLTDSYEDTPMVCTPRANSRVVKIVSKHSNV